MPIYDFHCPTCGLDYEISRSRDEAGQPAPCPKDGTPGQRNYKSIAIPRAESSDLDFDLGDLDGMDGMDDMMGGMGGMGGMPGMGGHSHGPGGHTHGPL